MDNQLCTCCQDATATINAHKGLLVANYCSACFELNKNTIVENAYNSIDVDEETNR